MKMFKFDTSKRAVELPDKALSDQRKRLNHDGKAVSDYDMYIDLREPLSHLEARELADRLASLDRIDGVRLLRIMSMDYTY
jgi:hypothetical protein